MDTDILCMSIRSLVLCSKVLSEASVKHMCQCTMDNSKVYAIQVYTDIVGKGKSSHKVFANPLA